MKRMLRHSWRRRCGGPGLLTDAAFLPLAMIRFRQTAARERPPRARTTPSPVRQRPITGVDAPQSPAGVRTMGASVRQFGEINDVPELEQISVKCPFRRRKYCRSVGWQEVLLEVKGTIHVKCSYCALTNGLFSKRLSICIIQKLTTCFYATWSPLRSHHATLKLLPHWRQMRKKGNGPSPIGMVTAATGRA